MKAPFQWFGGKSKAAPLVWRALGNVPTYVEPFAGSLAVLLKRPHAPHVETVNDVDGYLVNFWRAVARAPDEVAYHANWPVTEIDLTARHLWLVSTGRRRVERLLCDPDFFDAQVAGWWVWGLCAWIGSGWCSGLGPWKVEDDELKKLGGGVSRQLPHLSSAGQGVNRGSFLIEEFQLLANRLRNVRICCGDWTRVLGPSSLSAGCMTGVAGVFLDPPYLTSSDLYGEATTVSLEVRDWALAHPDVRVVLASYEGEFDMPGWRKVKWAGSGASYGSAKLNNRREVLWLSPACLF